MIDGGSNFKGTLQNCAQPLKLPIGASYEGNIKETSSKHFTNFCIRLKKILAVIESHTLASLRTKKSQYACNSAPIDDKETSRILAAIGR